MKINFEDDRERELWEQCYLDVQSAALPKDLAMVPLNELAGVIRIISSHAADAADVAVIASRERRTE